VWSSSIGCVVAAKQTTSMVHNTIEIVQCAVARILRRLTLTGLNILADIQRPVHTSPSINVAYNRMSLETESSDRKSQQTILKGQCQAVHCRF